MSEEPKDAGRGGDRARPTWIDDAEEALERVGESLRSAWEETREPRMSALESAKQAAELLGAAIDRGVEAARDAWQAAGGKAPQTPDETEPAAAEADEED